MADVDISVFMTLSASLTIAVLCAYLAYRTAIKQTRKEIKEAFEDHIQKLHTEHAQVLQQVGLPPRRR